MKKIGILIGLLLVLGVVFTTTLQAQDKMEPLGVDTTYVDPLFEANPHLFVHAYSDPWAKSKLMQQDYETFNRVWEYHRKQTTEMCIGLGIGAVGIAGMVYAVNMPTPTRQVNNPALDPAADEARRDRRIVGATSIVVGTVGAVVFARSFRWTRRMKAEIGLQSLRLEFNLNGNRNYFHGKKRSKKLKTLNHHWKY
jgi:hypothetical protein